VTPRIEFDTALLPDRRLPSSDGVDVATYLLGDDGGLPLLAAHATGFCAAVLAPLAAALGIAASMVAFDERGHGASRRPASGSYGWNGFAADALAVADGMNLRQPVGFGHSCGGTALLLAEIARPGTFRSLYLYEPILPPIDRPIPGGVPGNPLSVGARRRRARFPSAEAAWDNYVAKAPFYRFDRRCLAAYVANGFRPAPGGGVELCCERGDEAAIYAAAFAHDTFWHLQEVTCPVVVAYGASTKSFGPSVLEAVADRLSSANLLELPGLGHFGPLEDPHAVARSIADHLA